MHLYRCSLPTPAENLAIEEAWLDMAEEGLLQTEILRFWQTPTPMVVIGRGSRLEPEGNLPAARSAGGSTTTARSRAGVAASRK